MSRLPFDASRVRPADPGKPALREQARYGEFDTTRPLTVTQVCDLLKRVLADRTPSPLKMVGEVSNFSDRTHWYFSLKDEQNVVPCVMWSSGARKCGFVPERGQQLVATGRLDFYGPQGKLQLYVDQLEPVGQGVLELKYRQLCEELKGQGYFDEARKRPMPHFPQHIAVVTSANGAALHDVIRTARQRWAGIRLTLIDVRVQGASAAPEVAAAIGALSAAHRRLAIDAIILTRGGGSLEDLWAFNERVVADAVLRCEVPIAAAIGHETDTTIAELVADLRCSTPTQAAARLVADGRAERQRLEQAGSRVGSALRRRAEYARARLEKVSHHVFFRRPGELTAPRRQGLEHLSQRLRSAALHRVAALRETLNHARHEIGRIEPVSCLNVGRHRVEDASRRLASAIRLAAAGRRQRIDETQRVLKAIGPANVLRRGYTYTTDAQGRLIQSVHQVTAGERIVTHVTDGQIESTVGGGDIDRPRPRPRRPAAAGKQSPTPPASRRRMRSDGTGGLFEQPE